MLAPQRPVLLGATIGSAGSLADAAAAPRGEHRDLVSKLEALEALNDEGVLTADEFEAAKRKLIAG